jgi:hypothetical protein
MNSDRGYLNKRVRETISALPDEKLIMMLNAPSPDYTPYALQAAREELSKRRQKNTPPQPISAVDNSYSGPVQEDSLRGRSKGCYIELWSDKNYEGEYLCIAGPAQYDTLRSNVMDWGDDVSSLCVGPNAFVEVFQDADLNGTMVCFGPNQEVADLGEFKFNDEIDSIKVINSIRILDSIVLEGKEGESGCEETLKQGLAGEGRKREKETEIKSGKRRRKK